MVYHPYYRVVLPISPLDFDRKCQVVENHSRLDTVHPSHLLLSQFQFLVLLGRPGGNIFLKLRFSQG